jgi:hypothetical protein
MTPTFPRVLDNKPRMFTSDSTFPQVLDNKAMSPKMLSNAAIAALKDDEWERALNDWTVRAKAAPFVPKAEEADAEREDEMQEVVFV